MLVEPYKSEILPYWRYKNAEVATKSAQEIYALFEQYREKNDFVGMDMARKFIQMGYTRARRYANHKGGKKYDDERNVRPLDHDPVKAEAAKVFKGWWDKIRADEDYLQRKQAHQKKWG
ncbi:putative cytoplasmic protein [Leclercia adecarboxylata ATCC 23216 = NBRC 102595]|nr:putative cytoplasmic protein [Leclercia adecarboxylata ATCC 23216 = NBRC 102595]